MKKQLIVVFTLILVFACSAYESYTTIHIEPETGHTFSEYGAFMGYDTNASNEGYCVLGYGYIESEFYVSDECPLGYDYFIFARVGSLLGGKTKDVRIEIDGEDIGIFSYTEPPMGEGWDIKQLNGMEYPISFDEAGVHTIKIIGVSRDSVIDCLYLAIDEDEIHEPLAGEQQRDYHVFEGEEYSEASNGLEIEDDYTVPPLVSGNRYVELDSFTIGDEDWVRFDTTNILSNYSKSNFIFRVRCLQNNQSADIKIDGFSKGTLVVDDTQGNWVNIVVPITGLSGSRSLVELKVNAGSYIELDNFWISSPKGNVPLVRRTGLLRNGDFSIDQDENGTPDGWVFQSMPNDQIDFTYRDSYILVDVDSSTIPLEYQTPSLHFTPPPSGASTALISTTVEDIEEEEFYTLAFDLWVKDTAWMDSEGESLPNYDDSMYQCLAEAIGVELVYKDINDQVLDSETIRGSLLAKYADPGSMASSAIDYYYWPRQIVFPFATPDDTAKIQLRVSYNRASSDMPRGEVYIDNLELTKETSNLQSFVANCNDYYDSAFDPNNGVIYSVFNDDPTEEGLYSLLKELVTLESEIEMQQTSAWPPGCVYALGDDVNRWRTWNSENSMSVFAYEPGLGLHIKTDGSPRWGHDETDYGDGKDYSHEIESDGYDINERGIWFWPNPLFVDESIGTEDATFDVEITVDSSYAGEIEVSDDNVRLGVFFIEAYPDLGKYSSKETTSLKTVVTWVENFDVSQLSPTSTLLTFSFNEDNCNVANKNYFGFGYITVEEEQEWSSTDDAYDLYATEITITRSGQDSITIVPDLTAITWSGPDFSGSYRWMESYKDSFKDKREFDQGLVYTIPAALNGLSSCPAVPQSDPLNTLTSGLDNWVRELLPSGFWQPFNTTHEKFLLTHMPELIAQAVGLLGPTYEDLSETEKKQVSSWMWVLRKSLYSQLTYAHHIYTKAGNYNISATSVAAFAAAGCLFNDPQMIQLATTIAEDIRQHCVAEPASMSMPPPLSSLEDADPLYGSVEYSHYRIGEDNAYGSPPVPNYQDIAVGFLANAYSYADRCSNNSLSDELDNLKAELDKHFYQLIYHHPFGTTEHGGNDFSAVPWYKHFWDQYWVNGLVSTPVFLAWWLENESGYSGTDAEAICNELLRVAEQRARAESKLYYANSYGSDVFHALLWYNYPDGGLGEYSAELKQFVRRHTGFGWGKWNSVNSTLENITVQDEAKLDHLGFASRWNFLDGDKSIYYQFDFLAREEFALETPVGGFIVPPQIKDPSIPPQDGDRDFWYDVAFETYSVGLGGAIFEIVQYGADPSKDTDSTFYSLFGKAGKNLNDPDRPFLGISRCYAKDLACGTFHSGALSRDGGGAGYPQTGHAFYETFFDVLPGENEPSDPHLWVNQAWWSFGGYLFGFVDPEPVVLLQDTTEVNEVNYFLEFPPWERLLNIQVDTTVTTWPRLVDSLSYPPSQAPGFGIFSIDSVNEDGSYEIQSSDIYGWRVAVRKDSDWSFLCDSIERYSKNLHWVGVQQKDEESFQLPTDLPEVSYILSPSDNDLGNLAHVYVSGYGEDVKFVLIETNDIIEVGVANFSASDQLLDLVFNVGASLETYTLTLYSDDPACSDPVSGEELPTQLFSDINGNLNIGAGVATVLSSLSDLDGKLDSRTIYYLRLEND